MILFVDFKDVIRKIEMVLHTNSNIEHEVVLIYRFKSGSIQTNQYCIILKSPVQYNTDQCMMNEYDE